MSHRNKESIVDTWVRNIRHQTSNKSSHDIQIAKILHQFSLLSEVVEISGKLNNFGDIVIWILIICLTLDIIEKIQEVLISNREFLQ